VFLALLPAKGDFSDDKPNVKRVLRLVQDAVSSEF
jgi:hypothetical protein